MTEREKALSEAEPLEIDEVYAEYYPDGKHVRRILFTALNGRQDWTSVENGAIVKRVRLVSSAALRAPASEGEAVAWMSKDGSIVVSAKEKDQWRNQYAKDGVPVPLFTHPAPATVTEDTPPEFKATVKGWTTHDSPLALEYYPGLDLLVVRIPASELPHNGGPARKTTVHRRDLLAALGGAR